MKILSVAWSIYDERLERFMKNCTGGGLAIKNICEYIGRKETSYLLIGITILPEMQLGNIHIVKSDYDPEIRKQRGKDVNYTQYMTSVFEKAVDEIRPDIINFHGYGDMAFSCIEHVCIPRGLLYVVTDHLFIGKNDIKLFGQYDSCLEVENTLYSIPNIRVIAVSNGMKRKILKDFPLLKEEQIKPLLNGTNFCAEYIESDLLHKYNIQNKKVLLCVGTLLERKNQLQIVKVFTINKILAEKICVIFCGKDGLDGRFQKEITDNDMSASLIYAGALSSEDMKKYYSIADGLIMPSYAEGLSIAALEAISYGLPVIMFSDSECADDLNDPKVVCLAANRTDESLSETIEMWYEKEWDKEYIKKYAEYFSMERMAQDYLNYYREIIADTCLKQ